VKTIKAHETSGDTYVPYVHEDRSGLSSADPKRSGRLITGNGMKLSERRDVGCRAGFNAPGPPSGCFQKPQVPRWTDRADTLQQNSRSLL